MFDPKTLDQLSQALVARMLPYLQNGNGHVKPSLKKLLNIREAADYLKRSETAIYRLVGRHQIPVVRNGRTLRFDREDLDRWIEGDKV